MQFGFGGGYPPPSIEGIIMRVLITRTTYASGQLVEAGKNYDLSDKDANTLLSLKKAVIFDDLPEAKTPVKKPKQVTNE